MLQSPTQADVPFASGLRQCAPGKRPTDPGFDSSHRALAEKHARPDENVPTLDQRDARLAGGDRKIAARHR